jgi:hypothetical protein
LTVILNGNYFVPVLPRPSVLFPITEFIVVLIISAKQDELQSGKRVIEGRAQLAQVGDGPVISTLSASRPGACESCVRFLEGLENRVLSSALARGLRSLYRPRRG